MPWHFKEGEARNINEQQGHVLVTPRDTRPVCLYFAQKGMPYPPQARSVPHTGGSSVFRPSPARHATGAAPGTPGSIVALNEHPN